MVGTLRVGAMITLSVYRKYLENLGEGYRVVATKIEGAFHP